MQLERVNIPAKAGQFDLDIFALNPRRVHVVLTVGVNGISADA